MSQKGEFFSVTGNDRVPNAGTAKLSAVTFEFRGLRVEETFWRLPVGDVMLAWVRGTLDLAYLPGAARTPNPVAHARLTAEEHKDTAMVEHTRLMVAELFTRHWLGDPPARVRILTDKEQREIQEAYDAQKPRFHTTGAIIPFDIRDEDECRLRKIFLSMRELVIFLRHQRRVPDVVSFPEINLPEGWQVRGAQLAECGYGVEVLVYHPSFSPVPFGQPIPAYPDLAADGRRAPINWRACLLATEDEVKSREARGDVSPTAGPVDPSGMVQNYFRDVCDKLGIPPRVFVGSRTHPDDAPGLPKPGEAWDQPVIDAAKENLKVWSDIVKSVPEGIKGFTNLPARRTPKEPTKVQRRTGGPIMDVVLMNGEGVLCGWEGEEHHLKEYIPPAELNVVRLSESGVPLSVRPLDVAETFG